MCYEMIQLTIKWQKNMKTLRFKYLVDCLVIVFEFNVTLLKIMFISQDLDL